MRTLLIVHRYLGVVVGLVVSLWCLSGFVMMYRGYPAVTPAQRLKGLEPLALPPAAPAPDMGREPLSGFRIETTAGRPVLHLAGSRGARLVDLAAGVDVELIRPAEAAPSTVHWSCPISLGDPGRARTACPEA